jgi:two-component system CheB/CheR fusion protein
MADKLKQLEMLKSQYVPTTEFYSQIIDSLQDYSIFTLDTELKLIGLWFCSHLRI